MGLLPMRNGGKFALYLFFLRAGHNEHGAYWQHAMKWNASHLDMPVLFKLRLSLLLFRSYSCLCMDLYMLEKC